MSEHLRDRLLEEMATSRRPPVDGIVTAPSSPTAPTRTQPSRGSTSAHAPSVVEVP